MSRFKNYIAIFLILGAFLSLFFGCAGNAGQKQGIIAASNEDPQVGFWVILQADENIMYGDDPFTAEVAFGSYADDLEYIDVTIDSEDFEVQKSCPDRYIVDGSEYSDEDFYARGVEKMTFDDLPQKFEINLTKKEVKELYSGTVTIEIDQVDAGGYIKGGVTLYYYGDADMIFFSTTSQRHAENLFKAKDMFWFGCSAKLSVTDSK